MNHQITPRYLFRASLLVLLALGNATAFAGIVISGGGLALLEEGGTFAPNNLAAGKLTFAQDQIGVAPHAITKVNDGVYGNSSSWIGGTSNSFVGLDLGATPVAVNRVAFGRDNPGSFTDRTTGTYTLQYTTVPNPTGTTQTMKRLWKMGLSRLG